MAVSGALRFSGKRLAHARENPLRKQNGTTKFTQTDVADHLRQIGFKTRERDVRRWESETNAPRGEIVACIAQLTGYGLSFFYIEDGEDGSQPPEKAADDDEESDSVTASDLFQALLSLAREQKKEAAPA